MTSIALRLAALLVGLALASPAEAGIRRNGSFPIPTDQAAEAATPAPTTTRGVVVTPGADGG